MKLRLISLCLTVILLFLLLMPASVVASEQLGTEAVPKAGTETSYESQYPCQGGKSCPCAQFDDTPALGSWAHDPIDWALRNGYANGMSATRFGVDSPCTRAQVVTFLWRVAGSPETEGNNPYRDVKPTAYYYEAVLWASQNGITAGKTAKTFAPAETCTRAQVVTFLWRMAEKPEAGTENPFRDIRETAYYHDAVLWAVHQGITAGKTKTSFAPDEDCTRAQIVTFLYRAFEPDAAVRLPILSYHNLSLEPSDSSMTVSVDAFRMQMQTIRDLGYTTVSPQQLVDYVERGVPLPEKAVMITFDDGYESNYTLAFPILQEFGFQATIFVIGVSVGKDSYKDTGYPIEPHFSMQQARQMQSSGLITVASHGYDVHEMQGLDPDPIRRGVLRKDGESQKQYRKFLLGDTAQMFTMLGESARFFAYPFGLHDSDSLNLLKEGGTCLTVLFNTKKSNTIYRGLPQSLFDLNRFAVYDDTDREALQSMLAG